MARHKLTETKVRSAPPGKHGDGGGLYLHVAATGRRSWVFVYIRHGRRREMGLGPYGGETRHVSLAAAREKAAAVREILGRGGDPFRDLEERRARVKAKTFGEAADELLETKERTFRNEKHKAQWRMTLTAYAARLRKIPVAEVATDDVLKVLRPLWHEKPETASRLRGRIERVLDYAKALGLREGENPARWRGHLDHLLGPREKLTRGHHAAMPWAEIPHFMARLQAAEGYGARALELTILCATRSGETLRARWAEIDLERALWTIPGERMKAGRAHVVPLSARALALLRALHEKRLGEHVFPGLKDGKPLSNMAMTAVMRRLGAGDFTVHGYRSSFRDWAGDATAFPRDLAELALAHRVGDEVERAYRRASAIEKRRKLMEAWAGYLAKPPATAGAAVVTMRRRGSA